MTRPHIISQQDQAWAPTPHNDQLQTYVRVTIWHCCKCDTPQKGNTPRYYRHHPHACKPDLGPDSHCWSGPYCPHCAEVENFHP
jgi:hypothetical protein